MVLTHINRALIYLAAAGLWLAALSVQGHPGRTDAEGCHAGTAPRHCHGSQQSERPAQTNPGAPAGDTGRPAPRKTASEERLCDQWECEADEAIAELERQQDRNCTAAEKAIFRKRGEHRYTIPDGSRWGAIIPPRAYLSIK